MTTKIPEPVRRFVRDQIHSAGQLEVLLLLRAAPNREWSVEEVARAQVATVHMAERHLEDLQRRRLVLAVGHPPRYRYGPSAGVTDVIDALADAYATRRVTVIGLIFSTPSPSHR